MKSTEFLMELSPQTLASYKKKAGAQASELDKSAFDKDTPDDVAKKQIAKANKRFSGIVKATKKEFDQPKSVDEGQIYSGGNKEAGVRWYEPRHVPNQDELEGLNEMDKSAPQPGRDGKVSHSSYGSRDKKGTDYFAGKEAPGKPITVKQMEKDALDILKKQSVAENTEQKAYHTENTWDPNLYNMGFTLINRDGPIGSKKPGESFRHSEQYEREARANGYGSADLAFFDQQYNKPENVQKSIEQSVFNATINGKSVRVYGMWMVPLQQGVAEQELDEACWKGYHKEGNKKMFGKTYPNCVKNTNEEEQLDEKCWDTHKQVGMKSKGGKMVPNCVPKESAIMKGLLK